MDELNFTPLLDNNLKELYDVFAPHFNIPSGDPYKFTSNTSLMAPGDTIMLELLNNKTDHPEADTIISELTK